MHIQILRIPQIKFAGRGAALLRIVVTLAGDWYGRARTRHQLASLDAYALKDIGLSETARRDECRRPFWR